MSSEIQEIMAELSADKEFQSPRERKLLSKVKKSNIEDLNVSGTSSDSIDLHSIEKRLKSLVHTAMQYDQQDG